MGDQDRVAGLPAISSRTSQRRHLVHLRVYGPSLEVILSISSGSGCGVGSGGNGVGGTGSGSSGGWGTGGRPGGKGSGGRGFGSDIVVVTSRSRTTRGISMPPVGTVMSVPATRPSQGLPV